MHRPGSDDETLYSDANRLFLWMPTGTVSHVLARTERTLSYSVFMADRAYLNRYLRAPASRARKRKLERVVEIKDRRALISAFAKRIADGFQSGDFNLSSPASGVRRLLH